MNFRTVTPPPKPLPTVSFEAKLADQLTKKVGKSGLSDLQTRTNLYARGAISSRDYLATLRKAGLEELVADIAGTFPPGVQRKALLDLVVKSKK